MEKTWNGCQTVLLFRVHIELSIGRSRCVCCCATRLFCRLSAVVCGHHSQRVQVDLLMLEVGSACGFLDI